MTINMAKSSVSSMQCKIYIYINKYIYIYIYIYKSYTINIVFVEYNNLFQFSIFNYFSNNYHDCAIIYGVDLCRLFVIMPSLLSTRRSTCNSKSFFLFSYYKDTTIGVTRIIAKVEQENRRFLFILYNRSFIKSMMQIASSLIGFMIRKYLLLIFCP